MKQSHMFGRILVWFSCGAASAVAAKLAVQKYPNDDLEILYCDTLRYESEDNPRFMSEVSRWIGRDIKILKHQKYADIFEVFRGERFLIGRNGAPCTRALKRNVGRDYRTHGDINIFGFTSDEGNRIHDFEQDNPGIDCEWILRDRAIDKKECYQILLGAGIELPVMYRQGYGHNNCIGCVKGGAGYWNKIRVDYPNHFDRMAKLERELNFAILQLTIDGKRRRVFLDELDPKAGNFKEEPTIECGPQCVRPE